MVPKDARANKEDRAIDLNVMRSASDRMITRRGVEIQVIPLSDFTIELLNRQVEKKYRDAGEPVDPPTYSFETIGGGIQTEVLDESSLEDPQDPEQTERNKQAWAAHKATLAKMEKDRDETLMRAQFLMGAKVIGEENPEFEQIFKALGVEIPDDPNERKIMYLRDYAMNDGEMQEFFFMVQMLSLGSIVPEEDIEAARATFRSDIRREFKKLIQRLSRQEYPLTEPPETAGEVAVQPTISGNQDGEIVGSNA